MGGEGGGEGEARQMFPDCKNSCLVNNINPQDFKHTPKLLIRNQSNIQKHGASFPRHPTFRFLPISC